MLGDVSAPLFLGLTEDSLIVRFLGSWFFMCHVVLSFLSSPRSTPTWTPLFFISLPRKRKEMSILLPFSCLYCPLIPHIKAVFLILTDSTPNFGLESQIQLKATPTETGFICLFIIIIILIIYYFYFFKSLLYL